MDQSKYRKCMTSYMKGAGKSKAQRSQDFCVGAKVCSSAANPVEAERVCRSRPPSEPHRRSRVAGKLCGSKSIGTIATCLVAQVDSTAITDKQMKRDLSRCMCKGKRSPKQTASMEHMIMPIPVHV